MSHTCAKIVHQPQLWDEVDLTNVRIFDDDLFYRLMYYKDRVKHLSLHGSLLMLFPYTISGVMAEFTNMTHLQISQNLHTTSLSFLMGMPNLVSLKLNCLQNLSVRDVIRYVSTCKHLQILSLANNHQLRNVAITCVAGQLSNLKSLDVRRCDYLMPKHVHYIKSKCSKMEVLYFTPHSVMWSSGHEWAKITNIGKDSKIEFHVEIFDLNRNI